jgi:hypothetical protein
MIPFRKGRVKASLKAMDLSLERPALSGRN